MSNINYAMWTRQCNMQPVAQSARRTTTKNLENAKRFLIKLLVVWYSRSPIFPVWHLIKPVDDALMLNK